MINGCEIRVAFTGDVAKALELAREELTELGYERAKLSSNALEMRFAGKLLTTDLSKFKHKVKVTPDGGGLRFAFGTGIVASYWTESDERWARERAEQVVAAIRAHLATSG